MFKAVQLAGPWTGVATSLSPHRIGQGQVSDGRNVFFHNGRLIAAPPFVAWGPHPVEHVYSMEGGRGIVTVGDIINDVRFAFSILPRNGKDTMLYVTTNHIYLGGLDRAYDVTPSGGNPMPGILGTPWNLPTDTLPALAHVIQDAGEWLVLSNRTSPALWRLRVGRMDRFEEAYIERSDLNMLLLSAKHLTVFGERLVFGSCFFPDGEYPHAVGWYGINGPFDTTFPTSGSMPLTDTPGPITGFGHIMDFLVVGKPNSITLAQKTYEANFPFAFTTRISGCGWLNERTVARVANGNGLIFLATDGTVRGFDANTAEPIDAAIRDLVADHEDEFSTCWAMYDNQHELYMLVFSDMILSWSFREKWWTIERIPEDVLTSTPVAIVEAATTIDELEGYIDDLSGRIDELPGTEIVQQSCLISRTGALIRNDDSERESYITSAEYRFAKPTTITRLIIRIRTLEGGEMFVRHSLDGGGTWTEYKSTARSDIKGITKVFYNFVATSEQFMFDIYFKGRTLVIEDMVVDIPVSKEEEQVTPLNVDQESIV